MDTAVPTDHWTLRVALPGVVMSLLLVGCGGDPTPSGAGSTSSPSTGTTSTSSPAAPDSSAAPQETTGTPSASGSAKANDGTADDTSGESSDGGPAPGDDSSQNDDGSGADTGAGLEVPEAPEETVASLSELLEDVRTAPLVTAPLPRAESARGRLVTSFPPALRPTRATRVETSSISPSGDRLQVALVASTRLAPEDVLLAYRTRLAGRGLVEQTAPPATAGSQAAAFRRGRSTVTVSVAPQGSGASYSVLASLHAGGE